MPYLKLETNVDIPDAKAGTLLKELSSALAQATGKPESVVQAGVEGGVRMIMAGSEKPTAYIAARGIGFPEEHARLVSERICALLERELDIPGSRVYISFDDYKGSMWGCNGGTFAGF